MVATAKQRIRDIRKRDIEVRILRRDGNPLSHQQVEVVQLRHAFLFGDNLWTLDAMIRDGECRTGRMRVWQERYKEIFNAATNLCYWTERPENDAAKTEERQGEPRIDNFAATVDWTLAQGMTAKGHPLFWSIPKCLPAWLQRYDLETQLKFAEVRVRNLVARFRGRIRIWNAINEPLWEPALQNFSKRSWPHIEDIVTIADYCKRVLRWCREEDPDAIYLINDYGLEKTTRPLIGSDGSTVTAASQRQRMLTLLRTLADAGALPNALGLQSHTGWATPREQWEAYDELATAGLPLHITEFWAKKCELAQADGYSPDEVANMQAEFVRNFLTCAFGHPAIEGFFFWGFIDSALEWRTRSGYSLCPIYDMVQRMIREEWWTREELQTDSNGIIRFNGFLGDYTARYRPQNNAAPIGLAFSINRQIAMPITLTTIT